MHRAAGVSSTDCVLALLSARANVNAAHNANRRRAMDMANSALQAVLREAGGVRASLGAGSAPSSREAFPERSRQARVPGQEVDRKGGFRGGKGRGGGKLRLTARARHRLVRLTARAADPLAACCSAVSEKDALLRRTAFEWFSSFQFIRTIAV